MSTSYVIAAIFADRAAAAATRDLLGDEYALRWLAVTQPAALESAPDTVTAQGVPPETHEIVEGSDGAVGAIGRFLSGGGRSLRRALEDHGLSETDAGAIDVATPPNGAVLVVHAPLERAVEAVSLLEDGGGRVFGHDAPSPLVSVASRESVDLGTTLGVTTLAGSWLPPDATEPAATPAEPDRSQILLAGTTLDEAAAPESATPQPEEIFTERPSRIQTP